MKITVTTIHRPYKGKVRPPRMSTIDTEEKKVYAGMNSIAPQIADLLYIAWRPPGPVVESAIDRVIFERAHETMIYERTPPA